MNPDQSKHRRFTLLCSSQRPLRRSQLLVPADLHFPAQGPAVPLLLLRDLAALGGRCSGMGKSAADAKGTWVWVKITPSELCDVQVSAWLPELCGAWLLAELKPWLRGRGFPWLTNNTLLLSPSPCLPELASTVCLVATLVRTAPEWDSFLFSGLLICRENSQASCSAPSTPSSPCNSHPLLVPVLGDGQTKTPNCQTDQEAVSILSTAGFKAQDAL